MNEADFSWLLYLSCVKSLWRRSTYVVVEKKDWTVRGIYDNSRDASLWFWGKFIHDFLVVKSDNRGERLVILKNNNVDSLRMQMEEQ